MKIGIKGWHPLFNTSLESDEDCVGGIELFIHFSEQNDYQRIIDSAKKLGWFDKYSQNEENFLNNNEQNFGCSIKLSIDRIQIPLQLLTQIDKNQLNIFAQYRFYDKSIQITFPKKLL